MRMKEHQPFGSRPSMEDVAALRFARYLARQRIVPDLMRAADALVIDHPILAIVTAAWAVVVERITR
jgi:hypothetical protein